jgi:hypothetical protein
VRTYACVFGDNRVYASFLKGRHVHTQGSIMMCAYRYVHVSTLIVSSTCYFLGQVIRSEGWQQHH